MPWNWEHKDWPKFTWLKESVADFEKEFIHNAGVLFGSLKHISDEDRDILRVNLMRDEAYKTSEIEGEILDRDSLQSSLRREFGLQSEDRFVSPAEQGIAEMMVDLYKTFDKPISHRQLSKWHEMVARGRKDLKDPGRYRTHDDPMQVISGRMDRPTVHFEAPPSERVPAEMDDFVKWFNGSNALETLTKAGIAHLYFESIHPFEDGNGRIGRTISEKALSQGIGRPTLIAISHEIERDKKAYYSALHAGSIGLEVTEWVVYFCQMVLNAQAYTQSMIEFLIEKGSYLSEYEDSLNHRQHKVVARIFKEGITGFKGGLSAENYMSITGTTASTATRDLQKMVEMGAFVRKGRLKGTRYYLNIDHPSARP